MAYVLGGYRFAPPALRLLAAQADVIVSGDKHLLNLYEYQGMRIWTAAQAVKMIGG